MPGFRAERLGEQIHQTLSVMLMAGVKDPALALVDITSVQVNRDLQLARVFYTVNGDEEERKLAAAALKRASAYLRHALSDEIDVRRVPELRFDYDGSIEHGQKIEDLLRQAREKDGYDRGDSEDH